MACHKNFVDLSKFRVNMEYIHWIVSHLGTERFFVTILCRQYRDLFILLSSDFVLSFLGKSLQLYFWLVSMTNWHLNFGHQLRLSSKTEMILPNYMCLRIESFQRLKKMTITLWFVYLQKTRVCKLTNELNHLELVSIARPPWLSIWYSQLVYF